MATEFTIQPFRTFDTKMAKEKRTGEQCSENEENLRKKNSRRAYQLMRDLPTPKQEKVISIIQDHSGRCLTEEPEVLN